MISYKLSGTRRIGTFVQDRLLSFKKVILKSSLISSIKDFMGDYKEMLLYLLHALGECL